MRDEILMDSDIISYYLRGNKNVVSNLNEYLTFYDIINISIISYYEIISGLEFRDSKKRLQQFNQFIEDSCNILPITIKSVRHSGKQYAELRRKGTAIDDIEFTNSWNCNRK